MAKRSIMLRTTALVFCDRCDAATARFERGWRAYIGADEETSVTVVCHACAERDFGEDEVVHTDWLPARASVYSWPELPPQRPQRAVVSATALLCAYLPIVALAFWGALRLLHAAFA